MTLICEICGKTPVPMIFDRFKDNKDFKRQTGVRHFYCYECVLKHRKKMGQQGLR